MLSRFELFVKNAITVISHFKVNRNVSISLYVWLVRTTSCLRSSTENDFRTRFLLVIIKRTFLELAWKRSEHLIVSEAPNNKTANCFH